MSNPAASLPPGFRFHPTDEELILHYLMNRVSSSPCPVPIIADVDIYKYNPWELPAKATYGDREWYFFSPRDRKYPNGFRPNRAAASGYWKATGTDKPIHTSEGKENIGVKKALVFYRGRPPKGLKTNWIMHEYRLAEAHSSSSYKPLKPSDSDSSMRLDDWVLCRIYKKNNNLQSVPLLMDQEQIGSALDGTNSWSFKNLEQEGTLKLQKSSSISDLLEHYSALSHLFDNLPPEMPQQANNSFMNLNQPSLTQLLPGNSSRTDGRNNLLAQQQAQIEPCTTSVVENSMKRLGMMDCYLDSSNRLLHNSKRQNCADVSANFSEQINSSLLEQHFINQQLLLNSELGLH